LSLAYERSHHIFAHYLDNVLSPCPSPDSSSGSSQSVCYDIHVPSGRVCNQPTAAVDPLKYLSLCCAASTETSAHVTYRTVPRTWRHPVLARKPWVDVRDVSLGSVPHEERVPARRGDARPAGRQRPEHACAHVRRPAHLHGPGLAWPRDVLCAGRAWSEKLLDLERVPAPGASGVRARERAHLCAKALVEYARAGREARHTAHNGVLPRRRARGVVDEVQPSRGCISGGPARRQWPCDRNRVGRELVLGVRRARDHLCRGGSEWNGVPRLPA
jgi:hypothetical protein